MNKVEKRRIKEIRESLDRFEQNENIEELVYIKNHLAEIIWNRVIKKKC